MNDVTVMYIEKAVWESCMLMQKNKKQQGDAVSKKWPFARPPHVVQETLTSDCLRFLFQDPPAACDAPGSAASRAGALPTACPLFRF
jgi:hypothetical protein